MKIYNDHFVTELIKSKPLFYGYFKRLIMTEKSLNESLKVIVKFDTETDENNNETITLKSVDETLSHIVKTLKRNKFLLIDSTSNIILEYEFNGLYFHIKLHFRKKFTHTFEFTYFNLSEPENNRFHLSFDYLDKDDKDKKTEMDEFLVNMNKISEVPYESVENWGFNYILSYGLPQILYIELSKENIRIKPIGPRSKTGSIMKGDYLLNESKLSFNLVDSLWNIKSIGIGKYSVSGHFRFQRCGVGLSGVKLIYIEKYYKSQYVRKSTRELVFG